MMDYVLDFSSVSENDGELTYFEINKDIPFEIKRVFSIYNVPGLSIIRANHASLNTEFVLQVVVGSVEVELDNGLRKESFILNDLKKGLLIPVLTWMKTSNFSKDAILMVYASETYKKCKYINNYDSFLEMVR